MRQFHTIVQKDVAAAVSSQLRYCDLGGPMLLANSKPLHASDRATIISDTWVVAALITALLLRLINLGAAALWLDETFTATWVQMSWEGMFRAVLGDNHLPLYPAFMKLWAGFFGVS